MFKDGDLFSSTASEFEFRIIDCRVLLSFRMCLVVDGNLPFSFIICDLFCNALAIVSVLPIDYLCDIMLPSKPDYFGSRVVDCLEAMSSRELFLVSNFLSCFLTFYTLYSWCSKYLSLGPAGNFTALRIE